MLHEIELENGYTVQVDYEYESSELDYNGTGYQGGVTINALWANLTDTSGNLLKVDILHFMQGFEEFDKDEPVDLVLSIDNGFAKFGFEGSS